MSSSEPEFPGSLLALGEIVRGGLCHRCGSCSGICPAGVIEPDGDYWPSFGARAGACTDCGLCVRVCPGREFSWPDHYRALFGRGADVADHHGRVLKAFLAYSADPELRARSTSGGVATALPRFMLQSGRAAAALAVRADAAHPWRPEAYLARSPGDLLPGMLSKYPACSTNHLLGRLGGTDAPLVFTGIPCQVHGLLRMSELRPSLAGRVALTVGLFCHSCLDHQAIRDLLEAYGLGEGELARVVYRQGKLPGYVVAVTRDGRTVGLPYPHLGLSRYRPNAKELLTFFFKFYSPARCRLCPDAMAEFADLSTGDPWIKGWQGYPRLREGYNLVLARTERGLAALEEAARAGVLVLEPFPEKNARESQWPMVSAKRRRAFYNAQVRRRAGLPVPEYGLARSFRGMERWRAFRHRLLYWAADRPAARRRLVRFLLSRPGRLAVGLIFFRRHVLEAAGAKLRARLSGSPGLP